MYECVKEPVETMKREDDSLKKWKVIGINLLLIMFQVDQSNFLLPGAKLEASYLCMGQNSMNVTPPLRAAMRCGV